MAITLGIIGGIMAADQAKANAQMQANMMKYNQRLEQQEAKRVEIMSQENARRQREENSQMQAQQIALLGKSGAAMASGSPLAILGASAADMEQKVQDIHYAGYNEAQQHRETAKMYQYKADVAKAQAPSTAATLLSIAGNTLSGAQTDVSLLKTAGSLKSIWG